MSACVLSCETFMGKLLHFSFSDEFNLNLNSDFSITHSKIQKFWEVLWRIRRIKPKLAYSRLQDLTRALQIATNCFGIINPLNPGAFCEKGVSWTFWQFLGWISAKLASIWSKMHLHHDSLTFLPLASRVATFWLRHAQESKFWVFGRESDLRL